MASLLYLEMPCRELCKGEGVKEKLQNRYYGHSVIRRDSCPLVETITCPRLCLRGRSKAER